MAGNWKERLSGLSGKVGQGFKNTLVPASKKLSGKLAGAREGFVRQVKEKTSPEFRRKLAETAREKWNKNVNKEALKNAIQNFDPQTFVDSVSKTFQKRGAGFYGTLATVTLSTYFLADLSALVVGEFIPTPPPARLSRSMQQRAKSPNDYLGIANRNLFNSQGLIPGEDAPGGPSDAGGPPIRSTLPLKLIGTLILSDPRRSIATIEDTSASMVYPVQVDDEVPGKIRVLEIDAKRVMFVNLASGRREFIDMPEEPAGSGPRINLGGQPTGPGIEKVAETQYNISRNEVDKALADFNNILTQARAVPNIENGVASGYKLFQIVPGSIYDKLGLQNGDVITGLNGTAINDPGKAFEMLSELKKSSHLELQLKKDGKVINYTYDIH